MLFPLDDVFLAQQHVNHVPQNMKQGSVNFLDTMNAEGWNGKTKLGDVFGAAAILSSETDGQHSVVARRLQGVIYVGRHAAGGDAEHSVAGLSEKTQLLSVTLRKVAVIADGG